MSDFRTIAPGDQFRHFKNRRYQIVAVAYHSETHEKMVVYQALYGDYKVYVRPYELFMGEVDHEKYPDVTQRYRFEKVDPAEFAQPGQTAEAAELGTQPEPTVKPEYETRPEQTGEPEFGTQAGDPELPSALPDGVNPCLLEFFDRKSCKEKIEYLNSIRNRIDDKLISDIAVSMDFTVNEGTLDERLGSLLSCLQTKARFECGRLRT